MLLELTIFLAALLALTSQALVYKLRDPFRQYKRLVGVQVPWWKKARWEVRNRGWALGLLAFGLALLGLPALPATTMKVPKNSVWAGGLPREWVEHTFKVKTATGLRPGRAVKRDTDDEQIQLAADNDTNIIGWLSERNLTDPDLDMTANAPAVGDEVVVVLQVPGAIIKPRNGAAAQNMGAVQAVGANGTIKAAPVAAVGDITKAVGRILADSTDGSGTENDGPLMVLGGT